MPYTAALRDLNNMIVWGGLRLAVYFELRNSVAGKHKQASAEASRRVPI